MVDGQVAERIDAEIKRRKELIGRFPRVIREKVRSLGLMPGEIEVKIAARNGLFVDIRKRNG